MNMLKFSYSWRCASVAIVSKTIDDFPDPDTPVKIVISRFGIRSEMSLRLFSRAPRSSMYSVMGQGYRSSSLVGRIARRVGWPKGALPGN